MALCFGVSPFSCATPRTYISWMLDCPLKKYIVWFFSSSILCLPSLSTTIHDAGVHTIGSMPSQLEQCVRHALILLLCQFYKYGGFRISPVLKPTDYIECIHWIQQHRRVSICEPIKSALHHHNLIQKPASASLSAHTSVTIWTKKLKKASS